MNDVNSAALVTTQWLGEHLHDAALRVIDASWHMPALQRDASAEFRTAHIPGAVYFDIDDIADETTSLPHMIPSAAKFSQRVGNLGIGNDHHVIVYDATGIGSAARAWWMLRLFGHRNVAVLDGGLPKWLAEQRPTAAGAGMAQAVSYTAQRNDKLVRRLEQVLRNVDDAAEQVLDARSAGRFNATEPEPRASLRGGHIPGSFNLPFVDLYDRHAKTMKPASELSALFDACGVARDRPIVTSCGSGVTACNLALALHLVGATEVATLVAAPVRAPVHIITRLPVVVPADRPNVTVMAGHYFKSPLDDVGLRRLYRQASVVVVTLKDVFQPTGYSVCLQAMACGRPVVLSDIRGLWAPGLYVDGQHARLVPPANPQAMAAAINQLLDNPEMARRIGENAQAVTLLNHRLETMDAALENLVCLAPGITRR